MPLTIHRGGGGANGGRHRAGVVGLLVGLVAVLGVAFAPAASANVPVVCNVSHTTGVGVGHHEDGSFTVPGLYDVVLQPRTCTGWESVSRAYAGYGKRVCAYLARTLNLVGETGPGPAVMLFASTLPQEQYNLKPQSSATPCAARLT